jgi:hypothetical protein
MNDDPTASPALKGAVVHAQKNISIVRDHVLAGGLGAPSDPHAEGYRQPPIEALSTAICLAHIRTIDFCLREIAVIAGLGLDKETKGMRA